MTAFSAIKSNPDLYSDSPIHGMRHGWKQIFKRKRHNGLETRCGPEFQFGGDCIQDVTQIVPEYMSK